jgi:RNA polymerase sigma factor (sigma-70 family)
LNFNQQELLAKLKIGDEKAFRHCYDIYAKKVYNTALSYLQNINDAEDVTQETFIDAFKSIHQFKEDASLSTWLYRITINKCHDFVAYKKRKKRFAFVTQLFKHNTTEPAIQPLNFEHPGILMEQKEMSAILFSAIEKLPENQKAAFILSKIEGQSQKEISAILQLHEKAVESLLQRAKNNLRNLLSDYYDENFNTERRK